MPTIQSTIWIDAPLQTVYAVAKDNTSFPEYMKDVKSLTVVSSEGPRVVSDYVGVVSAFGLTVKWRQEDIWDDLGHACAFRQLEGDYDRMEGTWVFRAEDGGVRFDSHLDYEYNVPTLGALVKNVIKMLVQKNMDAILAAIKERSEAASS